MFLFFLKSNKINLILDLVAKSLFFKLSSIKIALLDFKFQDFLINLKKELLGFLNEQFFLYFLIVASL